MKKNILTLFLLIVFSNSFATTFYYNGAAGTNAITTNTNWGTATNGGGTNPTVTEFTAQAHTYIMVNTVNDMVIDLSTAWALGAGSTLTIGDPNPIFWIATLRILVGGSITGATVNVANSPNNAPRLNKLVITGTSIPTLGTLGTLLNKQSSVEFAAAADLTVPINNYGDLIISGNRTGRTITLPAGQIGISSTLSITATGSPTYSINAANVVNYNGSGNVNIPAVPFQYSNLTISNAGVKNILGSPRVNGIFSIQGDADNIGSLDYAAAAVLEYRNFNSPRTRSALGYSFRIDNYGGGGSNPNTIRVADGATVNIDDVIPSQTSALPAPNGTWSTPQCKMFCDLEITGTGRVNINNGCRIDLFKNLITSGGGQLGGVAGSRIHISGNGNVSIGKINTSGFVCLDKDSNLGTFTDNLNVSDLYVWNPIDGNAVAAGLFSFNPGISITAGTLTMGKEAPGTPLPAKAYTPGVGVANGTLILNNTALGSGATHVHNITGNVTIIDGTIDFSTANMADNESVVLNIGGNFSKTGGTFQTSSADGKYGKINFNGNAQNLYNTTAGSTATEVNYYVVSPSVSTLTNNFDLSTGSGASSIQVNSGGTLDFNTRIVTAGAWFTLTGGGTVRTANADGFYSTGALGSVQTTNRYFSSTANYVYNGTTAEVTGVFTTAPTALTVNSLTINNAAGVTASQNFTVNGTYTGTAGIFDITGRTLSIVGDIANSGTGTLRGGGTANLNVLGTGAIAGPLRIDQSTPGVSRGTGAANDLTALIPGTSNRFNNVTLNRTGGTLTLSNEIQVTNTLTPTAGTLASGGNLVMLSTASTTSSILAVGGAITGDVVVQSFFKGGSVNSNRGFRMITSPINSTASFFQQIKNRFIVTCVGGTGVGCDFPPVQQPLAQTLQSYLEPGTPTAGSFGAINHNSTMEIGRGYYFFFRGNRSSLNQFTAGKINAPFTAPEDWTATYIGTINSGNIPFSTVRSSNAGDPFNGINLVGNPYPATLDFAAFQSGNSGIIDNYISMMKSDRTGFFTSSGGVANGINETTLGSGGTVVAGILAYIQPGQGFFVRKTAVGAANITFQESHKASAANSPNATRQLSSPERGLNGKRQLSQAPAPRKLIRISLKDADNRDDATIVLEPGNATKYEGYDAPYLGNSSVAIASTTSDGINTAINFMPPASEVDSIKLYITGSSNPALKLSFSDITGADDKDLILLDKYTNTKTPITSENNSYILGIDRGKAASFGKDRLVLLLAKKLSLSISEEKLNAVIQNNGVLITWQTISETDSKTIVVERSQDGKTFNAIGSQAGAGTSNTVHTYSYLDKNPENGTLYYRLRSIDSNGKEAYSKETVSVNYGLQAESALSLYPNPAKNEINLSWKTSEAVGIKIYDMTGKEVQNIGNVKTNNYKANLSNLSTGSYIIKLESKKSNNTIAVSKFVKE